MQKRTQPALKREAQNATNSDSQRRRPPDRRTDKKHETDGTRHTQPLQKTRGQSKKRPKATARTPRSRAEGSQPNAEAQSHAKDKTDSETPDKRTQRDTIIQRSSNHPAVTTAQKKDIHATEQRIPRPAK